MMFYKDTILVGQNKIVDWQIFIDRCSKNDFIWSENCPHIMSDHTWTLGIPLDISQFWSVTVWWPTVICSPEINILQLSKYIN